MRAVLFSFMLFIGISPVWAQTIVTGADGVQIKITNTDRIITVGGSVTETVYALGFGDQVIATDQSSTYPQKIFSLPRVPYVRTLTAEGILALQPTLILASSHANPQTAIQQMRDAGTSVLLVNEEESLQGVITKLEMVGKALHAEKQAKILIAKNRAQYHTADSVRAMLHTKPTVMFVLTVRGESTFMVAGKNTSAQSMIELAGGKNAFDSFEGYKTVTNEAILVANPDYVLVMDSRLPEIKVGLTKTSGVNLITAVQKEQFIALDGNYLLGFGPRFGSAILELMQLLHPHLTIES